PPLDKPGVYLWPGPVLSEVVSIQPTVVTDIQRGALAVSVPVDPQKIVAELEALKVPARLEADGKVIAATRAAIPPGAKTASFPVSPRGSVVVESPATAAGAPATRIVAVAVALATVLG